MSGPVLLYVLGDLVNGAPINGVLINGLSGAAALYAGPGEDSEVFDLYIGGKLRLKEKVCGIRVTPQLQGKRVEKLVPVCDKVKP